MMGETCFAGQKDEEKGELSGHEKSNWGCKHPFPVRPNRSQALRVCTLELLLDPLGPLASFKPFYSTLHSVQLLT